MVRVLRTSCSATSRFVRPAATSAGDLVLARGEPSTPVSAGRPATRWPSRRSSRDRLVAETHRAEAVERGLGGDQRPRPPRARRPAAASARPSASCARAAVSGAPVAASRAAVAAASASSGARPRPSRCSERDHAAARAARPTQRPARARLLARAAQRPLGGAATSPARAGRRRGRPRQRGGRPAARPAARRRRTTPASPRRRGRGCPPRSAPRRGTIRAGRRRGSPAVVAGLRRLAVGVQQRAGDVAGRQARRRRACSAPTAACADYPPGARARGPARRRRTASAEPAELDQRRRPTRS